MEQAKNESICWLKITDYMQGWLQKALGGNVTVKGRRALSVQQLPGAQEVMMMGTEDDLPGRGSLGNAISSTWYNALEAGLSLDPSAMESQYGITRDTLQQYVPIVCPRYAVAKNGIVRSWTSDTYFGRQQSIELQKVLRNAFWRAVREFSVEYADAHKGKQYAQIDMIEDFCMENNIEDTYVDAIRREWQRRVKRNRS